MDKTEKAIPILPSRSIAATVDFYQRLGFEGGAHAFDSDYAWALKAAHTRSIQTTPSFTEAR